MGFRMTGDDILTFDRVTLYGRRGPIVRDVSLALPRGGFGVLSGPTGGGKTTILRLAHFDRKPDVGTVRAGEFSSDEMTVADVAKARRKVGMIFQDYKLLADRSAGDNVALALEIGGLSRRAVARRTMDLLAQVGLASKRHMPPVLLSGGEQQRLSIARALAYDPEVLLADEPTGNLDQAAAEDIMALLRRINHRGTTVLLATHDLGLVKGYGYHRWEVEQGRATAAEPL
jgi:cell division transport system ATP-binding protein